MGAIGLDGDRLHRIFVRSLAAATARSTEEGTNMETWVGNQDSVLEILSARANFVAAVMVYSRTKVPCIPVLSCNCS